MIASGLAPTTTAPSPVQAGASAASSAGESGSGEFDRLMNPPATADAKPARPGAGKPSSQAGADRTAKAGAAPDDAAEPAVSAADADADDTEAVSADAALPDQLLALIGGWPAPSAKASAAAAPVATAGQPGTAAGTAPPPTPLLPSLAGATDGALPVLPAGDAAQAGAPAANALAMPALAASVATGPAAAAAAATDAGASGAIPLVDFAQVLDQAVEANAGDATTGVESADRTLPTAATTAPSLSPTRAVAAAGQEAIAFPADPDAGFDDAFGARIGWLAEQRIGRAEIRLNPEQLGTIDVRLQIDGNRVSAEFHSAQADVRHALESSVGRLRDMLGQQGLQLAHSDVGQGRGDGQGSGGSSRSDGEPSPLDAAFTERSAVDHSRGLLDEYA